MNEQISWDQSLVKKYGSSNHFKLLNQLRNEVKKYPLNKNKNLLSNIRIESKFDSNDNLINSKTQEVSLTKINDLNNENKNIKSTVSFNNSKNFSIYNSIEKDSKKKQQENNLFEDKILNQDSSNLSFKDRLKQIDMK